MAKYGARRGGGGGKYGSSRGGRSGGRAGGRSGGRGASRYGGKSSRGRGGRYDDEDEYYDEEPAYQPAARKGAHEQAGLLIFGGAVVVVIITIIWIVAGGSEKIYEKATGKASRKVHLGEMDSSEALGRARSFDAANPYEDKEIVAAKYRDVFERYPNSQAASEARRKYDEVMARRR